MRISLSGRSWWHSLGFHPLERDGAVNQTERVLALLLTLAILALLVIAAYALSLGWGEAVGGFRFLIWSLLTAFAAWLAGILLGLLFGLPTVVEVQVTDSTGTVQGQSRSAGGPLGYRESTNLEQIADWITKILIGLTLTQYSWWQLALEEAFSRVSTQMLGVGPQPATPAAVIALAFAANGFLVSYLVMRRYFITEMVRGRTQAEEVLRMKLQEAGSAGLLQRESITRITDPAENATAMADRAADLAPQQSAGEAKSIAEEVRQPLEYPDDPWRGKFDGTAEAGGCVLTAKVAPLQGSSELFTVRLSLTAADGASRAGQSATFYLHPTFGPEPKKVAFDQKGLAVLEVIAYGAFTVGVLLETGEKLELNLAALADAPQGFRLR